MTSHQPAPRGIDHLVLCVDDLSQAADLYEKLGFTVTPTGRHDFGTGNRLVQLHGCFLELLTVMDTARVPADRAGEFNFAGFNRDYLLARQGMSMLVFESADARADQAAFTAAGLETYPTFDFERAAILPDGSTANVGFSLTFVTDPRMPDGAFFCCQQHAPEYFWKPDYQRHANGATTIREVVMVAEDPRSFSALFQKLHAPQSVSATERQVTVTTPRGDVSILTPSSFQDRFPIGLSCTAPSGPHFAAFGIAVDDIDVTRSLLQANAVPFGEASDLRGGPTLQIGPASAFGTVIEFAETLG